MRIFFDKSLSRIKTFLSINFCCSSIKLLQKNLFFEFKISSFSSKLLGELKSILNFIFSFKRDSIINSLFFLDVLIFKLRTFFWAIIFLNNKSSISSWNFFLKLFFSRLKSKVSTSSSNK